jgi:hypothetical protein
LSADPDFLDHWVKWLYSADTAGPPRPAAAKAPNTLAKPTGEEQRSSATTVHHRIEVELAPYSLLRWVLHVRQLAKTRNPFKRWPLFHAICRFVGRSFAGLIIIAAVVILAEHWRAKEVAEHHPQHIVVTTRTTVTVNELPVVIEPAIPR